jgi:hypothetical protein
MTAGSLNLDAINSAAARHLPHLVQRWLPNGRRHSDEWVALNPRRHDRRLGSFSINIRTGKWADFATGDKGGDIISLGAYLFAISHLESARALATILGVRP